MNLPMFREFREIYEKSGITTLHSDYIKRMAILTALTFVSTAVLSTIVHGHILKLPVLKLISTVFLLSFTACGIMVCVLFYYPYYCRNQMRAKIESGLVYTLSYMTVLSAGGISIDRVMQRVSEIEENPPLKQLAQKYMVDTQLLGFDVSAALKDISRRSPSEAFSKLMNSVNNAMQTKGDIKDLLMYEVERQLQSKRDRMKREMGAQNHMGEIYITLLVIAPILFILMLTILSILGGPQGASTILQLTLFIFFGIPVMAIGFLIILDMVLVGEE